MLGASTAYQKTMPSLWTESDAGELVQHSKLPDHWKSGGIISYRLINWCIAIIRQHKLVMKHRLPEICELLCTSRCEDGLARMNVKAPLKREQVPGFVQKVNRKMKAAKSQPSIIDCEVEFPQSASESIDDNKGRTQAWVNQHAGDNARESDDASKDEGNATDKAFQEYELSDDVKGDIEDVADASHVNLVELHRLIEVLDATSGRYTDGAMDDEEYEDAVRNFKRKHQKNSLDAHHLDGKLDIIGCCCPFEDDNSVLVDLVTEKHKTLVKAYYQEELHTRVLLVQGLDFQDEKDVRQREKIAIELVNNVLGTNYSGEADPVDHCNFVKSFLEYVVDVVPKHCGKKPDEGNNDGGESSNGASGSDEGAGQQRQSLVGSQKWNNIWEKHLEEAREEKRKLEEEIEIRLKLQAMRSRVDYLQSQLDALHQEASEDGIDMSTEGSSGKRRRDSDAGGRAQKKKK